MAKGCELGTGYLHRGGLPRNSVDRVTDRPDMTSAGDRGRKASTQTKRKCFCLPISQYIILFFETFNVRTSNCFMSVYLTGLRIV